ncbi:reverse transcriptase domain-containing protein [Tanacetum coccineum]
MYVPNFVHNTPVNSEHRDGYVEDPDPITRISKLDASDPLHLHPNDSSTLTVVLIKLKGTENYQVWSCAMLLALEGKNKTGFTDGSCKRSNTDEFIDVTVLLLIKVELGLGVNDNEENLVDDNIVLIHEMQKLETELWNHAMVKVGHAAYTVRFHELARLVPHLISGALTDEAVRNGSIKKVEKRGNVGEPSKDKNGWDDNKRARTGNAFDSTANPIRRENTSTWPKCTTCNSYHAPGGPCRTYFNYNRLGHLEKDYRGVPRNVNPVNAKNLIVRACYECGSTDLETLKSIGQDTWRVSVEFVKSMIALEGLFVLQAIRRIEGSVLGNTPYLKSQDAVSKIHYAVLKAAEENSRIL